MAPLAPSKLKLTPKPQRSGSRAKTMSSTSAKPASNTASTSVQKRKVAVTKTVAEPAPESDEESEEDTPLHGFSSDEDSSDDDDAAPEIPGVDVGKLPTIAKDDVTVKRKLEKAKREPVSLHILSCHVRQFMDAIFA